MFRFCLDLFRNGRDNQNKSILIQTDEAPLVKEAFEIFATGIYDKQHVRRTMWKKGLRVSKTRFPLLLSNPLYCGRVIIPPYQSEPMQVVIGIHEPIVSEQLFDRVQAITGRGIISNSTRQWRHVEDNTPLRGMLCCSQCGKMLTSSQTKGRNKYYWYYHCQRLCNERINASYAHDALRKKPESLAVEPELAELFLKVRENYYKNQIKEDVKTTGVLTGKIKDAEERLVKLENKYYEPNRSGIISTHAANLSR